MLAVEVGEKLRCNAVARPFSAAASQRHCPGGGKLGLEQLGRR